MIPRTRSPIDVALDFLSLACPFLALTTFAYAAEFGRYRAIVLQNSR
jgi:hypothetical protein